MMVVVAAGSGVASCSRYCRGGTVSREYRRQSGPVLKVGRSGLEEAGWRHVPGVSTCLAWW